MACSGASYSSWWRRSAFATVLSVTRSRRAISLTDNPKALNRTAFVAMRCHTNGSRDSRIGNRTGTRARVRIGSDRLHHLHFRQRPMKYENPL